MQGTKKLIKTRCKRSLSVILSFLMVIGGLFVAPITAKASGYVEYEVHSEVINIYGEDILQYYMIVPGQQGSILYPDKDYIFSLNLDTSSVSDRAGVTSEGFSSYGQAIASQMDLSIDGVQVNQYMDSDMDENGKIVFHTPKKDGLVYYVMNKLSYDEGNMTLTINLGSVYSPIKVSYIDSGEKFKAGDRIHFEGVDDEVQYENKGGKITHSGIMVRYVDENGNTLFPEAKTFNTEMKNDAYYVANTYNDGRPYEPLKYTYSQPSNIYVESEDEYGDKYDVGENIDGKEPLEFLIDKYGDKALNDVPMYRHSETQMDVYAEYVWYNILTMPTFTGYEDDEFYVDKIEKFTIGQSIVYDWTGTHILDVITIKADRPSTVVAADPPKIYKIRSDETKITVLTEDGTEAEIIKSSNYSDSTTFSYGITGTASGDTSAPSKYEFTGLDVATEYVIAIRKAESSSGAGDESEATLLFVSTLGAGAPASLDVVTLNPTKIEVDAGAGAEYSIDGTTWQDSGVFDDLDPDTDYQVYARTKNPRSSAIQITLHTPKNNPPEVYKIASDEDKITVQTENGTEAGIVKASEYSDSTVFSYSTTGTASGNAKAPLKFEFTGLDVATEYVIAIRKTETSTGAGDASDPTILYASTLGTGVPASLDVVTLEPTKVEIDAGTGAEYSIDGATWQDSGEFTGLNPDTNYTIYARTKDPRSSAIQLTVHTPKNIPPAPTLKLIGTTDTKIEVNAGGNAEYSLDGITWHENDGKFTGLSPETEYTIYARTRGSGTTEPSAVAKITIKTTATPVDKADPPENITIVSIRDTILSVNAGVGVEYMLEDTAGNEIAGWQNDGDFSGLTANTTYVVKARTKQTGTTLASDPISITVTTNGAKNDAPNNIDIPSIAPDKIVLDGGTNAEYSTDGVNYSDSGAFDGLTPDTTYTFYIRTKDDGVNGPSDPIVMKIKTPVETIKTVTVTVPGGTTTVTKTVYVKADIPVVTIEKITDKEIVVSARDSEFSLDGSEYQSSGDFTGLKPETAYTLKARKVATGGLLASDEKDPVELIIKTDKAQTGKAPENISIEEVGYNFIAIDTDEGYEYSIGGEWQQGGLFTDLTPETPYTVYIRKIGEEEPATSVTIKTEEAKSEVPRDIRINEITDTSASIEVSGAVYSIDGANWQDSGEFTGLTPNTDYTMYIKIKESLDGDVVVKESDITQIHFKTLTVPVALIYPDDIEVLTHTANTIEVGAENSVFSIDGVVYKENGEFTGLTANTQYNIRVRNKDSQEEVLLRIKTLSEAAVPQTSTNTEGTYEKSPKTGF